MTPLPSVMVSGTSDVETELSGLPPAALRATAFWRSGLAAGALVKVVGAMGSTAVVLSYNELDLTLCQFVVFSNQLESPGLPPASPGVDLMDLLEQLQHALRNRVGLGQHRGAGLDQDL